MRTVGAGWIPSPLLSYLPILDNFHGETPLSVGRTHGMWPSCWRDALKRPPPCISLLKPSACPGIPAATQVTCVCSGVHSPGTAALRKAAPLAVWRAWSNQAKPPMRAIFCPLTRAHTPTSVIQPIAPSQPAQMPLTVPFPSGQRSQPLWTVSCKAQGQLKPLIVALMWSRPQEVAGAPVGVT